MEAIPFALSVSHFVNSAGADAGFAAIIGLALLAVLYFAQARETHSLRTHAAQAEDRFEQLEVRVAALSRAQTTAEPPRVTPPPTSIAPAHANRIAIAGAPAAASGNSGSPQPITYLGAPAGVGAPALTAATRLIPGPVAFPPSSLPGDLTAPVGAPSTEQAPGQPPPGDRFGLGLAPVTAAGAAGSANGVARDSGPRLAAVGDPPAPPPRVALRPPGGGGLPGGARGRGAAAGEPSRPRRGLLAVLAVLGALVVAAVVVIVATGSSSPTRTTSTQTVARRQGSTKNRHPGKTAVVNPALVTVAVLNGTATPNLAHDIGSRLAALGYKEGSILTAPDQTQTSTLVGFLPGHRNDALAVATSLKLHTSSVAPVSQSNRSVACPPPAPCAAGVVVSVGSDLSTGA